MIKLSIQFRTPADREAFEQFYTANLALVERIPHILRRQVCHVYGAPDGNVSYYRILEVYFEDRDTLDLAMRSPQGVEAGQHLMDHAAQLVEVFFSEVYEEAGGSTPRPVADGEAAEADTAEADAPD